MDIEERIAAEVENLKQYGYESTNLFVTQEGAIFDMDGATCPKCGEKSELSHRSGSQGYFHCPNYPTCQVMYDEPNFTEWAFVTSVED